MQKVKEQAGNSRKRIIRLVMLLSMVAFLGRMGFATLQTFTKIREQPTQTEVARAESIERESELKAKERGYEIVLEREPENQVALEGLVNVRLEMNDAMGAIAPLEKLVELNPEKTDYKQQLAQAKQQAEQGGDRE